MRNRILASLLSLSLFAPALSGAKKRKMSFDPEPPAKSAAKATKKKSKRKMSFAPAVPVDDRKARAKLKVGVDLYQDGKFLRAALTLGEIADGPSEVYETVKDDADYYLAVSLYQLGYYLSALHYFDRVVKRGEAHPHHARTVKWLALLAHRIQVDQSLLKKISTFPTDKFQPEIRDELLFLLGRYYFNVGDATRAASFLSAVDPKSKYYAKAKYFEGLVAVKEDIAKDAVKAFRRVADMKPRSNYEDFEWVQQLGTQALARAYYSAARYKRSAERYAALGKMSPLWLDALFESSWSFVRTRKYEKAMGNLFTLATPFFESEYYPESDIVQAIILFRNCKYARMRRVLDRFKKRYVSLERQLSKIVDKKDSTSSDFWELFEGLRSGKKSMEGKGKLFKRVLSIALNDSVLNKYTGYLAMFDSELQKISNGPPDFKRHPLAKRLFQELTLKRSFAVTAAGKQAKARFKFARDQIRRLLKQSDVLLFELENAEKNRLEEELIKEQEIPKEAYRGKAIETRYDVPKGSQYWPFEGEYWRDELGFYEYQIRSDCKPKGKASRRRASR